MSSFTAEIAPVKTTRGDGSAAIAGSAGPGWSAVANSPVSATFGASRTCSESARMRRTSSGALARTRSARRAKRSSAARKLAVSMRSCAEMSSTQW